MCDQMIRRRNISRSTRRRLYRMSVLNEEEMQVVILQAMMLSYPVVAEMGYCLLNPVAVVVSDEQDLAFLQKLSLAELLPLTNTPSSVAQYLENREYNLRSFQYGVGRYTKENLQKIETFATHIATDISEQILVLIVHIGLLTNPSIYGGIFYLDKLKTSNQGKQQNTRFNGKRFVQFMIEHEAVLREEILFKLNEELDQNEKVLEAILCVLENYWKRMFSTEDQEKILPCFHRVAEKMKKLWLPVSNAETYVTAFVKVAYEITDVLPCVPRTEAPPGQEQNLDQMILFDDLAYYVPINYLDKICEQLSNGEGTAFIKGQLCEAGLLEREGRGRTYYTKMTEILIGNRVVRRRYAKLRREKMDLAGRETWLEVMQMKGEKN